MRKVNFKKLALLGLTGGAFLTTQLSAGQYDSYTADSDTKQDASDQKMTENELMSKLNAEGKKTYQSMDSEGKALALKLANQSCAGKNDCKGLNSCKTDKNTCAGNGSCKGTSKGPFTDKNMAVKVAAKKMAEKRSNLNSGE